MPFFTIPTSFQNANPMRSFADINISATAYPSPSLLHQTQTSPMMANHRPPPHSSHPALPHLTLLVFEAVLEVVCVSLPGYIVARQGMFSAEMQKFAANLNVSIFTPCLIFTKLASQLTTDKLVDLAVIPLIFLVQTLVSFLCSFAVSKAFRFTKRPRNFVIAMGVFGNSNSLPISLVLSLSQTISGLHWNRIPDDNDSEVAARGILYLLIFQQLGQLVRWSWGYNVLLAPPDQYDDTIEHMTSRLEGGLAVSQENEPLMRSMTSESDGDEQNTSGSDDTKVANFRARKNSGSSSQFNEDIQPEQETHDMNGRYTSIHHSKSSKCGVIKSIGPPELLPTPAHGNIKPPGEEGRMMSFPRIHSSTDSIHDERDGMERGILAQCCVVIRKAMRIVFHAASDSSTAAFDALPKPMQTLLTKSGSVIINFLQGLWSFMNPPLWAMLAAIVVASIPALQRFFFTDGTFFKNSVTSAIRQSGGVAVPLILVVLGANLARNTLPTEPNHTKEDDKEETRLLIAALVSRMLLPTLIMAPLLAITAKYVPVSILDDPIFVIVCFLITGAPSALQLAQICQINNVYMGAMSRLLFQSYVVWILPSTLILVMCALEVVEWAQR